MQSTIHTVIINLPLNRIVFSAVMITGVYLGESGRILI